MLTKWSHSDIPIASEASEMSCVMSSLSTSRSSETTSDVEAADFFPSVDLTSSSSSSDGGGGGREDGSTGGGGGDDSDFFGNEIDAEDQLDSGLSSCSCS